MSLEKRKNRGMGRREVQARSFLTPVMSGMGSKVLPPHPSALSESGEKVAFIPWRGTANNLIPIAIRDIQKFTERGKSVLVCACSVASVVSNSLQPEGLQPARLLCPWDFPSKNIGVGCHALLQGPQDRTQVPCISCTAGRFFTPEPQGKPQVSS